MAKGLQRIESVWAWVCTDKSDGTEGVPAVQVGGMAFPMYATKKALMEGMQTTAEEMAAHGHEMRLVEFTRGADLITLVKPEGLDE